MSIFKKYFSKLLAWNVPANTSTHARVFLNIKRNNLFIESHSNLIQKRYASLNGELQVSVNIIIPKITKA